MSFSRNPPRYSSSEQVNRTTTSRVYGIDQKPAKYDLIREQARRDNELDEESIMNMNPIQFDASRNSKQNATSSRSQEHSTVFYPPSLAQARLNTAANQLTSSIGQLTPEPPQRRYNNNNISMQQQQFNNDYSFPKLDNLTNELAQKEAKLRREIAYMNTYKNRFQPKSSWDPRREPDLQSAPSAKSHKLWHKEVPQSPFGSRPTSRASSARSVTTEADVLEKAAKLLEDAQELERKEIIDDTVILDSRGEQRAAGANNSLNRRGIKSAIINVPDRDIDNKSPLPFSYDNFSTLGVRGNIASVGAAKPDKPYPPIFPQIKRTRSPLM